MRAFPSAPLAVIFAALAALSAAAPAAGQAAQSTRPAVADSLLSRLVGTWRMTGEVRGRPAAYELVARRVLAGQYVELHMVDTARPPQYEARVFVGADTLPDRVLVHWLDSFGAAYSVPAATGGVVGDTLRFEFAYSSGPFRDTFVYDRPADAWTMRLESGDGRGGWRPFAAYAARRARAPAR
jgi:hypothetical protein